MKIATVAVLLIKAEMKPTIMIKAKKKLPLLLLIFVNIQANLVIAPVFSKATLIISIQAIVILAELLKPESPSGIVIMPLINKVASRRSATRSTGNFSLINRATTMNNKIRINVISN